MYRVVEEHSLRHQVWMAIVITIPGNLRAVLWNSRSHELPNN
ncbi:hypothetical protein FLM9_81 [Candidatus Synechococcus spongiarum]|uniref:Uncharacterized protein n=1 Tax=Candidatus Synechococcus spongiarum TaxID=431041 RepID=A0A171DI56_9SYNE|nr:hypothetical protein FLM9_81 [Candidatus Synechococcus spongiarum]